MVCVNLIQYSMLLHYRCVLVARWRLLWAFEAGNRKMEASPSINSQAATHNCKDTHVYARRHTRCKVFDRGNGQEFNDCSKCMHKLPLTDILDITPPMVRWDNSLEVCWIFWEFHWNWWCTYSYMYANDFIFAWENGVCATSYWGGWNVDVSGTIKGLTTKQLEDLECQV